MRGWRSPRVYFKEKNSSCTSLSEFKYYNTKHEILTKDTIKIIEEQLKNKDRVYYTTEVLKKKALGLLFKKAIDQNDKQPIIEFYILKFTAEINREDYNQCVLITSDNLGFQFELSGVQRFIIEEMSSDNNQYIDNLKIIKTWEEAIPILVTSRILDKFRGAGIDDMNRVLTALFPECKPLDKKFEVVNKCSNKYFGFIERVVEKRFNNTNYRIAVIAEIDYSNPEYNIKIYPENHPHYNYIDEGRFIIDGDNKTDYFLALECIEYYDGKILINQELYKNIARDVNELTGNNILITPTIYNFYKERVSVVRDWKWSPRTEMEAKIIEQYKSVLHDGRGVKIGNVLITNESVEIQNENFKIEFTSRFLNTPTHIGEIRNIIVKEDIRYNANAFYEKLLEMSEINILKMDNTHDKKYKDFEKASFKINGMNITIKKEENKLYINDIFCRIDDLYYILTKAICYTDVYEYGKYIHEVSHIGIEWKRLISNGVLVTIKNPYKSLFIDLGYEVREEIPIRMSFLWDEKHRRQIYLYVNGKKYLIENKIKFKKWFNKPQIIIELKNVITRLKEAIPSLTTEDVIELIDFAEEEGKIIQKRGEELVHNTLKDTNTTIGTIDVQGNTIEGYHIVGRVTKSLFFIKKNSLDVYKYTNGAWNRRCVVDDHSKHRIYEDRLANRIANIYNELAKITTIHNT